MVKLIVATHERLAQGFKQTLDYIAPNTAQVVAICAYVDNLPIDEVLANAINDRDDSQQIIILTDLAGGSVNQECAKLLSKGNIKLIAGLNFPLLLSIALSVGQGSLTDDDIRQHIEDAKQQMIFINDMLNQTIIDLDDE